MYKSFTSSKNRLKQFNSPPPGFILWPLILAFDLHNPLEFMLSFLVQVWTRFDETKEVPQKDTCFSWTENLAYQKLKL